MRTLTVVFEDDNDYIDVLRALKQYQTEIENKTKDYIPMEELAGMMLHDTLIKNPNEPTQDKNNDA